MEEVSVELGKGSVPMKFRE